MPERRSNNRKKDILEARWECMSRRHEGRVDDESVGGGFVNAYGHVEFNEPVNLQMLLPSGDWLALKGTVASYHPGVGFGMSFELNGDDEQNKVKELIVSAAERAI